MQNRLSRPLSLCVLVLSLAAVACDNKSPQYVDAPTPVPKPPTAKITATSPVLLGKSTTITWESTNATSVNIDPLGAMAAMSGTRTLTPDKTTTYTMVASSADAKSAPQSVTVTVVAAEASTPTGPPTTTPNPGSGTGTPNTPPPVAAVERNCDWPSYDMVQWVSSRKVIVRNRSKCRNDFAYILFWVPNLSDPDPRNQVYEGGASVTLDPGETREIIITGQLKLTCDPKYYQPDLIMGRLVTPGINLIPLSTDPFYAKGSFYHESDPEVCTAPPTTPTTPTTPKDPTLSCSVSPTTVTIGQIVTATSVGGNGTTTWAVFGGTPDIGSGTAFASSFATSGVRTFVATSGLQTAACAVVVNTPPVVIPELKLTCGVEVPGQEAWAFAEGGTGTYLWTYPTGKLMTDPGSRIVVSYTIPVTPASRVISVTSGTQNANCTVTF